MLRVIAVILTGIVRCLWAFCVGFAVVFTGKMAYYGLRDAVRDRK